MLCSSLLFSSSDTLVLIGNNDITDTIAFRIANEQSLIGNNVLYLTYSGREMDRAHIPMKADIFNSENAQQPFDWSPRLLQNIDLIHIQSVAELKLVSATAQTLAKIPNTIVIDNLSTIIDPFQSTSRNSPEFLLIVVQIRFLFLELAKVLSAKTGKPVKLIFRDSYTSTAFLSALGVCKDGSDIAFLSKNDNCRIQVEMGSKAHGCYNFTLPHYFVASPYSAPL